jgi:hypothetical protein
MGYAYGGQRPHTIARLVQPIYEMQIEYTFEINYTDSKTYLF